ncbi:MAG: MarC family protein [Candidatus Micrarchaeota archaeon]
MLDPGFFVAVFVGVFLVTDPFANIPIFEGFLSKMKPEEKRKAIEKSYLVGFLAFFVFSFFGPALFGYLGIELFSFKIAGGLLLLVISGEMLLGFKTRTELSPSEQEAAEEKENLAFTPLGIPLITGPGAIITGIVFFARTTGTIEMAQFVAAAVLAFVAGLWLMLQSDRLNKLWGPLGMKLATRIMGLLLMSLAVQLMINGLFESGLVAAKIL